MEDSKAQGGSSSGGRLGISIENWIGLWLKHFNKDPKIGFRDLVYCGF
jgi:hypothetical protein